jgi:hypothetical protein
MDQTEIITIERIQVSTDRADTIRVTIILCLIALTAVCGIWTGDEMAA